MSRLLHFFECYGSSESGQWNNIVYKNLDGLRMSVQNMYTSTNHRDTARLKIQEVVPEIIQIAAVFFGRFAVAKTAIGLLRF